MIIKQQWSDPKQLHALSQQELEQALGLWQHTLEYYQQCVVEITQDLDCLQQEQARRQGLAPEVQDAPADTVPASDRSS